MAQDPATAIEAADNLKHCFDSNVTGVRYRILKKKVVQEADEMNKRLIVKPRAMMRAVGKAFMEKTDQRLRRPCQN